MAENGNLDRLIGKLIAQQESLQTQLTRIESSILSMGQKHEQLLSRILVLELDKAKLVGGWKATAMISTVVLGLWSLALVIVQKLWPLFKASP